MKKRYLIPTLVILSIVSLFVGVSSISVSDLLDFQSEETEIFLISRLPRLVAILLAGAGMSMAGLIMQQLSRNKFVSPTTAGTLCRLGLTAASEFGIPIQEQTRLPALGLLCRTSTLRLQVSWSLRQASPRATSCWSGRTNKKSSYWTSTPER